MGGALQRRDQGVHFRARIVEREATPGKSRSTPKRDSSGWAQWVPARTATPERSITVATSWACAPFISKENKRALARRVPNSRR